MYSFSKLNSPWQNFQILTLYFKGDDVPRKNPGKNQKRWKKAELLEWLEPKGVLEEGKKYTVKQLWEIMEVC